MKTINKKTIISILSSAFLIVGVATYLFGRSSDSEYSFETVRIEKGSINNTITATGTLEATNTVIVGTQVSGVIEKLYVDFNSEVKKGQLIAELDKATLQSSLENAEADVDNANAEFEYQESNLNRIQVLFDQEMLAESDYDLAKYNFKRSEAGLKSAKANLNRAKRNLGYAMIYSPIDGIVINRAVEEGQTVAASMNTPELFTITNKLLKMQVEADVDEADIGMVEVGQRVEFTVDAFPDEIFNGSVAEVRLQPVEISNVVTYTVIIAAQNPELKLKPGMTASITDYVKEVNNVFLLAGKAFRFKPDRTEIMSYMNSLPEDERPQRPIKRVGGDRNKSQKREQAENIKRVWVKTGNIIKPVRIEIGVTDGTNTQVISGLKENDEVIVAMELGGKEAPDNKTTTETQKSPFVQERPRRK